MLTERTLVSLRALTSSCTDRAAVVGVDGGVSPIDMLELPSAGILGAEGQGRVSSDTRGSLQSKRWDVSNGNPFQQVYWVKKCESMCQRLVRLGPSTFTGGGSGCAGQG